MGTRETATSVAMGVDTGGEHPSTCARSGPVCSKSAAPASNPAISLTLTPSSNQERRSPIPRAPHPRPAVPIAPGSPHPHPLPTMPFALAYTYHKVFYQCFSTDISRQTTPASRGIGDPIQREARPFTRPPPTRHSCEDSNPEGRRPGGECSRPVRQAKTGRSPLSEGRFAIPITLSLSKGRPARAGTSRCYPDPPAAGCPRPHSSFLRRQESRGAWKGARSS